MNETQKLKERIEFLEECCKENSKFQNKILEIGARVGDFRRGETICLYKAIYAIEEKLSSAKEAVQETCAPLVEALEKLAKLGNGERYGNSDGNVIAQQALAAHNKAMGDSCKAKR